MSDAAVIADIGGTHARFAILDANGTIVHTHILRGSDYTSLTDAFRAYQTRLPDEVTITRAALAVAGPVTGDHVCITNQRWDFSQAQIQKEWHLDRLHVINDFTAIALSLPHLSADDKIALQPGLGDERAPLAVLGPGTGLGVSGLVPVGPNRWQPLSGEGGHVALSATNEQEAALLAILQKQFAYVSAEHVLSGQGLVNLYYALGQYRGIEPQAVTDPVAVSTAAQAGDDLALAALEQFCAFLGTVAGDVALTLGARGGVYLAGGILPRIVDVLQKSEFVNRFSQKGVVASYLQDFPVWLITQPIPAFTGLRSFFTTCD